MGDPGDLQLVQVRLFDHCSRFEQLLVSLLNNQLFFSSLSPQFISLLNRFLTLLLHLLVLFVHILDASQPAIVLVVLLHLDLRLGLHLSVMIDEAGRPRRGLLLDRVSGNAAASVRLNILLDLGEAIVGIGERVLLLDLVM